MVIFYLFIYFLFFFEEKCFGHIPQQAKHIVQSLGWQSTRNGNIESSQTKHSFVLFALAYNFYGELDSPEIHNLSVKPNELIMCSCNSI